MAAKRPGTRKRRARHRRSPTPRWPAVRTHPPRGTCFAVPDCDCADFLAICGLADDDQGKAEWDAWQEEQQGWHRLLQEAGFRPVDIRVTGQSYRRFLEENEEVAQTRWSVWMHAGQIAEQDAERAVYSVSALLIST
jgi:hypothetical protein